MMQLFDLVGFDKFDFIEELLTRRQEIVAATVNSPSDFLQQRDTKHHRVGPHLSSQVTIQSEEEVRLKKKIRKEEKREERRLAKHDAKRDTDMEQEDHLRSVGFDPERMRHERELALLEASNTPLFSSKAKSQPHPAEMYPHVYDAQLKAQQASAFVAGAKVCCRW